MWVRRGSSGRAVFYRARYFDGNTGRFLSEDPIGFKGQDANLYRYVENNPIRWVDPLGLSKWYPVPGNPGWEVRRDKPHHPKDYTHEHYRKRGKEIPRKVDPKTGKQKPHGKGKCKGPDQDVPQEVIDAASQAQDFTGDVDLDLTILEMSESFADAAQELNDLIPRPPILPIPMPGPLPIPAGIPVIP